MLKHLKLNKNFLYFFFIIIGIATIFYQLNFEDFWIDEMQSFWISDPKLTWNETIQRHKIDYHTPILFNLVLKYFLNVFNYNPEVARYLPFIFGSLLIKSFLLGVLYALTRFSVCLTDNFFDIIFFDINKQFSNPTKIFA